MQLNNESKTLFIPLFAKAKISKKNLFLKDKKAEEIVLSLDGIKKLKQSKYLNMFLSVRALIIDELCNKYLSNNLNTTVIHLGCGLDSRFLRVNQKYLKWFDLDFENVINIRKNYYKNNNNYQMIGSSVIEKEWLNNVEVSQNILVVAEGLTMYLSEEEIKKLILNLGNKFKKFHLIFDAYSKKAVRFSKIKNPVKKVRAKIRFGIKNYKEFLDLNKNLQFVEEHIIKKEDSNLKGIQKFLFNNLYCGKISQSLYKIYEFSYKEN